MACDFGHLLISFGIFIVLFHFYTLMVFAKPQVPCYFIFGDSWVDTGNNNKLKTKCKVNYPPYGIDFPEGSTGRFTNGRNSADLIGQYLGFNKFTPTYATASKHSKDIKRGVNYGSGCAGIRQESGRHLGDRVFMDRQLRQHKSIVSKLSRSKKNRSLLKKCVYIVNMGSNDYVNNFFLHGFYNTSNKYTKKQFAKVLVKQYSKQLKTDIRQTLYRLGGRKIAVFGLANMGCAPIQIFRFGTNGKPCVQPINDAVRLFNDRLMNLVVKLNKDNSGAKFTFINLASILSPLGDIPLPSTPCCPVREDWQCIRSSNPCLIRDLTIFFDGMHPTESCNFILARRSFSALSPSDAYPYDISHLARL